MLNILYCVSQALSNIVPVLRRKQTKKKKNLNIRAHCFEMALKEREIAY